ncbi:radical SAM/SPASM domain-containing protein [Acidobacteriota bacterium]
MSSSGRDVLKQTSPNVVFVELTNHCNMHCTFCPSELLKRKRQHIDDEALKNFLGQLHRMNISPPILLNVLGEPMLNKRLIEYLDWFEESGHAVTLITNMTLLGKKDFSREILRHNNVTLALSLQTATKESYRMRGYPQLRFKEFFGLIYDLIEMKFQLESSVRLEIHIASNYVVSHDSTIQSDSDFDLWKNFEDEESESKWIRDFLKKIDKFRKKMAGKYPDFLAREEDLALNKYKDHIGTKIAVSEKGLPSDFHRLKDELFWGYMFLPNVFLVFKALELWTRDLDFLKWALPEDRYIYVEERSESRECIMTDNLGILANGDLILCCLDYEGEMNLGNIRDIELNDFLSSERRAEIRRDAMSEALCRRCKGNVFIFDTSPLKEAQQTIDKFGRGWEAYESQLYETGGRWTTGKASAYVLNRIQGEVIDLSFFSEMADDTPIQMKISVHEEASNIFAEQASEVFYGRQGEKSSHAVEFFFKPFKLYRIEIISPIFIPDNISGNGDKRELGIAVFELTLRRGAKKEIQ